jgi:hypothetical protein
VNTHYVNEGSQAFIPDTSDPENFPAVCGTTGLHGGDVNCNGRAGTAILITKSEAGRGIYEAQYLQPRIGIAEIAVYRDYNMANRATNYWTTHADSVHISSANSN